MKMKMGSMIRKTVANGPRGIIEHISNGEETMECLNSSYRHAGAIQAESFFKELLSVRYDGGNPTDFVT